ncbi:hypothetical protein AAC387_Pa03g1835 [Persea americana]
MSSQVTSTEISPFEASSPETVTSEITPLQTDYREKATTDDVFFNENPVNWSQIPNLIGDVWTEINYSTKKKSCWMLFRTCSRKMFLATQSLRMATLRRYVFSK